MFQIKKNIIILFALVLVSEFTNANSYNRNQIFIDISEQRLNLFEKDILKQSFPDKDFLVIGTKVDLLDETNENLNSSNFNLVISNETQLNIEELKNYIYNKANPELKSVADSCNVSINSRQADLLRQCKESLAKALEAADSGIAHDFWTIDLKAAIARLGEITGDDLTEEILDNMFSQFCIGK